MIVLIVVITTGLLAIAALFCAAVVKCAGLRPQVRNGFRDDEPISLLDGPDRHKQTYLVWAFKEIAGKAKPRRFDLEDV